EDGYYPESFVNMLALLGWNPGTEQEIFSMEELIQSFSLDRVHKSGSRFDPEKAKWFNHWYLQQRSDTQIAMEFREVLRTKGFHIDMGELEELVRMVKERVSFVREIWDETDFFFKAPESFDPEAVKKRWKPDSPAVLKELQEVLEKTEDFSPSGTEASVRKWIEEKGYNMGAVMNAFRLVMVGSLRGPHMFEIISWIGREETSRRIQKGISSIGK
ncbi:MAG TPA: glutamate--tRNA ligase family protein, partial [Bacteroidales bacterium]|nr:glutamate--tRNA ligase family protein [Bacteroidales bacterium]